MSLQLPGKTTLESMYKISDKSIWFLVWIFKKVRFWPDLTKEVLEVPFIVERIYWSNGLIGSIYTKKKDGTQHGIERRWYENGQLHWEKHWKDGKQDGIFRGWHENGQLYWEEHWKDGKHDGIERGWYKSGQLYWEHHWKDGNQNGIKRCWRENGQLYWEQHWKDGRKIIFSNKN